MAEATLTKTSQGQSQRGCRCSGWWLQAGWVLRTPSFNPDHPPAYCVITAKFLPSLSFLICKIMRLSQGDLFFLPMYCAYKCQHPRVPK